MADNAPEQISINGQEFALEDAARLIQRGQSVEEMESKLNTSLDKVYPEYTRTTQLLKDREAELADAKAQLTEFQAKQERGVETPKDIAEARKAARELGLADQDWLTEQGYIRKSDLDEYFNQRQTQQVMAENILKQCAKYEQEIDGSDGRVPFDTDAVLSYASVKNIADPLDAYKQMNAKGNSKWEAAELARAEKPGLTTLRTGGVKTPEKPKITNDNLGASIGEWLDEANLGN